MATVTAEPYEFEFDPKTSAIKDLGPICDPATGAGASNIHMLVEGDAVSITSN